MLCASELMKAQSHICQHIRQMQVLLLMVDAIKPQTVLMTGNRQLHRDTPAGPAFHPAALANVEDSLSARPPAHRAAAMPSFGGGSYHPSPGSI